LHISFLTIIFFLIFLILLSTLFKKGSDIFSPARLFAMVWTFVLGLTELKLSHFQFSWSTYSWFILLISLFAVLLGIFVVYVINYPQEQDPINYVRFSFINSYLNKESLYKIILGLFIAYIVSYIIIYLVVGFIPLFTAMPNIARTKWSLFGFGLIVHLAPTILYFIVVYFFTAGKSLSNKFLLVIVFLITFVSFLLLLQRFDLVISIILTVVFLYYGTKKFNSKTVFIVLILFILFMYGISSLRTSSLILEYLHKTARMKYSAKYAMLTEPYMYFVMNLENFAHAVNKMTTFNYGFYSFDFILALSGVKHWLSEYLNLTEYPFLVSRDYNTYGMFFAFYRDFGIVGVTVLPFIFGFILGKLYFRMRKKPNLNTISLYGIFVMAILFSFFNPMLSWLYFELNLAIIYLLTKQMIQKIRL